jgi:hypothetical protein
MVPSVNPFASLGTTKLDLGHGLWVVIKDELGAGESLDAVQAGIRGVELVDAEGGSVRSVYDNVAAREFRVAAYVVDWNFPGLDGKTAPLGNSTAERRSALAALSRPWFDALEDAIEGHAKQYAAARAAQLPGTAPAAGTGANATGDSSAPQG